MAKSTLVKFVKDCTPYSKGDVVNLTKEEKEKTDERAKNFKPGKVYETTTKKEVKAENSDDDSSDNSKSDDKKSDKKSSK